MAKVDKYYHPLLEAIIQGGYVYEDTSRGVNVKQISSANVEFDLDEFPAVTTKKLYWKGIVTELLWFLRGESNIKFLNDHGVHIWDKDAANFSDNGDVGRNYGVQWRNFTSEASHVDQIENLIKGLVKNPMCRRHIVTAWNPAELDETALPPCHWAFEIIVRPTSMQQKMKLSGGDMVYLDGLWEAAYLKNDKEAMKILQDEVAGVPDHGFILKWHQRSVDTFLGLPFNIASYGLLANIIGHLTGIQPLSLIGDLSNVHIYEPHLDAAKKQLHNSVLAHDGCQLKVSERFLNDVSTYKKGEITFTQFINQLEVEDFQLPGYTSFKTIKAEMIAPKQ